MDTFAAPDLSFALLSDEDTEYLLNALRGVFLYRTGFLVSDAVISPFYD